VAVKRGGRKPGWP